MKANVLDETRYSAVSQSNMLEKPAPQKARIPVRKGSREWFVIVGLLVLSFIPITAGAFRLNQLSGGAQITPANARFFASPLPVIVHIVSASLFAILGAFQFAAGFRRRWPAWHRVVGRVLVVCGLLVGFSGLWMTIFYPRPVGDGNFLSALRLLFGSTMIVSIVLSFVAIRRGDVTRHSAWMMRGYAIGLGAGTQALILMAGEMIAGKPSELSRALLIGASWVINLAVSEWVIRRQPAHSVRTASAVLSYLP